MIIAISIFPRKANEKTSKLSYPLTVKKQNSACFNEYQTNRCTANSKVGLHLLWANSVGSLDMKVNYQL